MPYMDHRPFIPSRPCNERVISLLKKDGSVCFEVPLGEEEYSNIDHFHFFTERSMAVLVGRYFKEYTFELNTFQTQQGITIQSLYSIGRYPY